jgi:4-hydroxy-tetrahydrodipicolinate reductase
MGTNKSLPKIALLGYGTMGREIEKLAIQKGYEITDIFELDSPIDVKKSYKFDVAIDFTYPKAVQDNVQILTNLKKNIVIGTTGWYDSKRYVDEMVTANNTGLIYSTNFSFGMQMMFRLVNLASSMANSLEGYDMMIHEIHHRNKKDSPSGTALTLGDIILKSSKNKKYLKTENCQGSIKPDELHISSTRGGDITGIHTLYIDSANDTIEITHRAKNRLDFANGALAAANWINGKKGVFEFQQMLEELFN